MTTSERQISCPLCDGPSRFISDKLRFERKGHVLQCQSCELYFLDQKTCELSKSFYESEYHQTYLTHVDPSILEPEKYFEKMLQVTNPWVERVSELLSGEEAILDVGCSTGHFLHAIAPHAAKVFGSELNSKEIQFCRERLKLDVSNEPLESRFPDTKFDLITLIFVLEHIGQPLQFLLHLKQFLKPGGRMIIVVPNISDALLNLYALPKFRDFYFCVEHLFYFSPKTLTQLLAKAGLVGEVVGVQEYPISNHLNWGFRGAPLDLTTSRQVTPNMPLENSRVQPLWESFWAETDRRYRELLAHLNYSDRVWCNVRAI